MRIHVQSFPSKVMTIEVAPSDTVANVKAKIADKDIIPVQQQRLLFAGNELKDEYTLDDYHIAGEDTIHLELRGAVTTTVYVSLLDETNTTIQVMVDENDTVEAVKRKIHEKDPSILVSEQKLMAGDRELKDNVKFSEYNIENVTRFHLSLNRKARAPSSGPCHCCCML